MSENTKMKDCKATYNAYDSDPYYDIQCELEDGHSGKHSFTWSGEQS